MKIKDKILSEISEEVKQRVRDIANKLVMKQEIDMSKYTIGIDPYDKQETLEKVAEDYNLNTINAFGDYQSFIDGAKWQQQQENTANDILNYILTNDDGVGIALGYNSREMIEQHFKNIGYDR